jgi:signal transduction histidine kinase
LSWRSYAERERYIDAVRPFAASPRLYEYLVSHPADPAPGGQVADLFRTLCGDVLGARLAYLVPLGPVTPLVGPGLVYPAGAGPAPPVAGVAHRLAGGAPAHGVALAPADHGGALWAVPLRSRRQLIGVLLLGEKRDGSLYAQEEIEIAQAAGERLMDTLAGAEMARRLMALQRQRLAESQVLDQKARRALHDDVLPLVHAAMLSLGGDGASHADTVALLADAHRRLSDLLHEMPAPATAEVERLGLAGALRRLVERDLADAFDGVAWRVAHPLPSLPSLPASVLFYAAREAMRNAARHARAGDRPIHLSVTIGLAAGGGVEVVVEDDGAGFDATTLHGGPGAGDGGQGLGLHSTMMAVVGGTLSVDTVPGAGTRLVLALPPGIERRFD